MKKIFENAENPLTEISEYGILNKPHVLGLSWCVHA